MLCNGLKITEYEAYWLTDLQLVSNWASAMKEFGNHTTFNKTNKLKSVRKILQSIGIAVKKQGCSLTPADILVGI